VRSGRWAWCCRWACWGCGQALAHWSAIPTLRSPMTCDAAEVAWLSIYLLWRETSGSYAPQDPWLKVAPVALSDIGRELGLKVLSGVLVVSWEGLGLVVYQASGLGRSVPMVVGRADLNRLAERVGPRSLVCVSCRWLIRPRLTHKAVSWRRIEQKNSHSRKHSRGAVFFPWLQYSDGLRRIRAASSRYCDVWYG